MTAPLAFDKKALPQHLAIIMDGNGRWAKQQGRARTFGHRHGVDSVRQVIEACTEFGIKYLTLYAFSKENWQRPRTETSLLMRLLERSLKNEFLRLKENNIVLKVIGDMNDLPARTAQSIRKVSEETACNTGMVLTLALSYSAKEEIRNAVICISEKVKNNVISVEEIDYSVINKHLYTYFLPDVDMLIRTSGEQRISNFMLWQCAYAEFFFTQTLWPDFKRQQLIEALEVYQKRERRFGKLSK